MLTAGQVLEGKYRIVRKIGGGAMGVVYEAEHIDLKMRVAIKVLHPSESYDVNMLARFKTEARSAAGIRHRNVVDVTDYGVTPDGRPFFAMEYLKGESLADRLESGEPLSEREAVEIADQILSGLAAAHKKRIVHRDLKPENIWITPELSGGLLVKILDFGIAKMGAGSVAPRSPTADLDRPKTQHGAILGTPGYMAPESITGRSPTDERSDLFAVGVLLYEMILGEKPFRGEMVHEVLMSTVTSPVTLPSSIRPELSQAMERLILTALAKRPDDRFQTADEFLLHLTAAAVGRIPEDARPCLTSAVAPPIAPMVDGRMTQSGRNDADSRRSELPRYTLDDLRAAKSGAMPTVGSPSDLGRASRAMPRTSSFGSYGGGTRTSKILPSGVPFGPTDAPRVSRYDGRRATVVPKDTVRGKVRPSKMRIGASPIAVVLFVCLAVAFWALCLRQSMWLQVSDGSVEDTVTIELDLFPTDAYITVDGNPVTDRPLVVPRGVRPIAVRATYPGMTAQMVEVIPDIDRSVELHLTAGPATE